MTARVEGVVDIEIKCECGYKEKPSCVAFFEKNNINWQCSKCEERYKIHHEVELEKVQRMRGIVVKANGRK